MLIDEIEELKKKYTGQYVKADANDDTMLAGGASLRDCYSEVVRRNGLSYVKGFQRMGLI